MHEIVALSRQIALDIHFDQVDQAGVPYVQHLERVASHFDGDPVAQSVAWLHDSFEDQYERAVDRVMRLPLIVVRPILILTRLPEDRDPRAYYRRVRADDVSCRVKIKDVNDNREPARLALLPPALAERLARKYERAAMLLTD